MKRCKKCRVTKPLTEFYIRPASPDGRYATCSECKRKYNRKNYKSTHGLRDGYTSQGCDNCAFLRECKDNIWKRTFTPYCWVSAKYHGLYQSEYRKQDAVLGS